MPPKPTRHCRESRRKADTEFQYRPRIVDTDIDCGPRVCGPRFRDSYSVLCIPISGTKKEPKPKLLSPDIFGWGGGLPREWVGAKKFGMSLETQGIKLFWRDIPGFCRDIPEAPEKFEKKMFGLNSRPLPLLPLSSFIFRFPAGLPLSRGAGCNLEWLGLCVGTLYSIRVWTSGPPLSLAWGGESQNDFSGLTSGLTLSAHTPLIKGVEVHPLN